MGRTLSIHAWRNTDMVYNKAKSSLSKLFKMELPVYRHLRPHQLEQGHHHIDVKL